MSRNKVSEKVVVQVLKNVAGKMSWLAVSEPLTLSVAQSRQKGHEKQYPQNTYRIVNENEE